MLDSIYATTLPIFQETFVEVSAFLPRLLGALLLLILGAAFARAIKRGVVSLLETMKVSSVVKKTPLEHFFSNAEFGQKVEEVIGSVFYWLLMLIVLQTVVAILGLSPVTQVIDRVISYIPNVLSSVLVLFLGVLLAGVVESVVKGSIKSIDGKSARLIGKISSYLVMTIAVLAAVSELGIASEFIMVLFIGFVATVSLGAGLALGLGGKDVVSKMLGGWYERTKAEISEK
jgi:predicted neutral ceramidase superfamily lipid hydrolase